MVLETCTVKILEKTLLGISSLFFYLKEKQKKWNPIFTIIQLSCKFEQNRPRKVAIDLKGTHARDFHSLFLNFFLHILLTKDTKRRPATVFEKILTNRTDIKTFR